MIDEPHDPVEERWNSLSHGVGFALSLGGGAALIALAAGHGGWRLAGAIVFAASLTLLYLASTLYHAVPHPAAKRRLKVFDHCAIYLLIAGTYTPFTLTVLREHGGWWLFGAIWTLAVAGIVFKLFHTGRFKRLSTLVYLGMGWMVLAAAKPFLQQVPAGIIAWLLAGGAAYSLGTIFYLSRRRHAHAVWHGFVLTGSGCHYVAVLLLLGS